MTGRVKHVTAADFTDDDWRAFYALVGRLHDEYGSWFTRSSWSSFKDRLLSFLDSEPHGYRFTVFSEERMVGWVDFRVRQIGTPLMMAQLRFDTEAGERLGVFAKHAGAEMVRLLEQYACPAAYTLADEDRYVAVCRAWDATERNPVVKYKLWRNKANLALIDEWIESISARNSDLRLDFFESVPEEHLERYVELFNAFIEEMPREGEEDMPVRMEAAEVRRQSEWRSRNNSFIYTYALFDGDRMIAHTNGVLNGADPTEMYQAMTGVDREYRGRGLSKWLKAVLFKKVGQDFPKNRIITTEMRAVNEPILRVNQQMGYEVAGEGFSFEIGLENLKESLKR